MGYKYNLRFSVAIVILAVVGFIVTTIGFELYALSYKSTRVKEWFLVALITMSMSIIGWLIMDRLNIMFHRLPIVGIRHVLTDESGKKYIRYGTWDLRNIIPKFLVILPGWISLVYMATMKIHLWVIGW